MFSWPLRVVGIGAVLFLSSLAGLGQSQEDAQRGQVLFNSGNSLITSGDFKGAVEKFSEAAAILPTWHLPPLNRGVANLSLGNLSAAEADADKALSLIRPGTQSADHHTAIAFQIKGTVKQHQGDLQAALGHFSSAVGAMPKNANFYNSRGNILRLLGRDSDAHADYSKAIELDPSLAMVYVNRASINETLGKADEALADVEAALRLNKNLDSAYYTRGNLRVKAKAYPEALADLNEAIRLDATKSTYFHARGILHTHMKKYDIAIKDQTQAIALDPRNGFAYSDRSIANGHTGNTAAAIADVRSAIAINEKSPSLRYNLAYFLFRNGQYAESAAAATQVIEKAPNWKGGYIIRSNAYIKLGAQAKAKADRDKAATLGTGGLPAGERHLVFDLEVLVPEENKQ